MPVVLLLVLRVLKHGIKPQASKSKLEVDRKVTLSELMRLLQDFGVFLIIILLAYVVYKVGVLIEVMGSRLRERE